MEEALLGLPPFVNGTFSSECDYKIAKILYSVAAPIVIIITLCFNILYITLINYDKDDRSASTVQATGISISNTLHGVSQLPIFFYFFLRDNMASPVSKQWCNAYRVVGFIFPNIFHTAALWQLVIYGIQRFICFRWPISALVWYKVDRFLKFTITVYVCASITHGYKFFDFVHDSGEPCTFSYRNGIDPTYYTPFYNWLCAIAVQIVPCVIMSVCVVLLIYGIRFSYLRRKRVYVNSPTAIPRNRKFTMQECQSLGILILTLAVEWPLTLLIILHITNLETASEDCAYTSLVIAHFMLLVSYLLFFPLFFILNFKLRRTFARLKSDLNVFFVHHSQMDETSDDVES
ncbi:sex peptide receptor-related protein 2-like [Mytilus trossulus]|uniref:sex peptide receptor-related protein 2-like n=1 Tax=Mytilus trossulus TaxID=6551 RepID=UPI003003C022